jgi:hypothetical protein
MSSLNMPSHCVLCSNSIAGTQGFEYIGMLRSCLFRYLITDIVRTEYMYVHMQMLKRFSNQLIATLMRDHFMKVGI